ncbi:hypothetical protein Fcan01_01454 [Folsomia candida]|uniref:Uncharacterized protein n=1 Tax=Folsomia candida TaxID=158441 RepID=A0A226F296_FOLCA|nr:hypothetical protein Fcan01_01454 [Folsomia candida]
MKQLDFDNFGADNNKKFPDDDSPSYVKPEGCPHLYHRLASSPNEDMNPSNIQQISTFLGIMLPTLIILFVILAIYCCCQRLRNRVPNYLSMHFPLYDDGAEECHLNAPIMGRRTLSVPGLELPRTFKSSFGFGRNDSQQFI